MLVTCALAGCSYGKTLRKLKAAEPQFASEAEHRAACEEVRKKVGTWSTTSIVLGGFSGAGGFTSVVAGILAARADPDDKKGAAIATATAGAISFVVGIVSSVASKRLELNSAKYALSKCEQFDAEPAPQNNVGGEPASAEPPAAGASEGPAPPSRAALEPGFGSVVFHRPLVL
jgi:hypothetical protein